MKHILIILITLYLLTITLSCSTSTDHSYRYHRKLSNQELEKAIREYITSTSLEYDSQFVTVSFYYCGNSSFYVISKSKSIGGIDFAKPDYFSNVDSAIVLLKSNSDQFIEVDGIADEFVHFAETNEKHFEYDSPSGYDAPIWVLIHCDGRYKLERKVDGPYPNNLPCASLIEE